MCFQSKFFYIYENISAEFIYTRILIFFFISLTLYLKIMINTVRKPDNPILKGFNVTLIKNNCHKNWYEKFAIPGWNAHVTLLIIIETS